MPIRGNILIVGTGNLSYTFCSALHSAGIPFSIAGRNSDKINEVASTFNAGTFLLSESIPRHQLAFLCVSDDSISEVSESLSQSAPIICHCSGSRSLEEIKAEKRGVYYPFQTFSGNRINSFSGIPIFLESDNEETKSELARLANELGASTHELNHEVRKVLHLAGVLANNFTTILIQEAKDMLSSQHISADVLLPLLNETIQKNLNSSLSESLTGPARRGDKETIALHLKALEENRSLKELYQHITKFIEQKFQTK